MNQKTLGPVILRYGMMGGLITCLIFLVFMMTGIGDPGNTSASYVMTFLSFAALVSLVVMAIKKQRDENQGGIISLGQCMLIGIGVILLAALISSIVSTIYMKIIDPTYMEQVMSKMEEAWEAQGLTEDQIEKARSYTSYMQNPLMTIAFSLGCYGIGGAVLSLIIGLIMRKEAPEFS